MENAQNMEIFKDIQGYDGYQISNLGRIWSDRSQKYLALTPNNTGYIQVKMIANNGKRKNELVHRLVALTFIDNPDKKPEVNHIDRDITNNCVSNLEWVTKSENNTLGRKEHYTHSQEWFDKRHKKNI